jgi:hypothetical protein
MFLYSFSPDSSALARGEVAREARRRGHLAPTPPRGFGTVQCIALLTLKPSNHCENASPAASRDAALKALEPCLNWCASLRGRGRLIVVAKALNYRAP